ncbi:hypothetical protein [uncultured Shewanella sp.]|uniref:hypothetical protein n=1 Tax=uncultured Shewanella sp. TaxID=173975 RepID=UPI0026105300|nr:hypothetical protein [uncultured Shewanella sp.]
MKTTSATATLSDSSEMNTQDGHQEQTISMLCQISQYQKKLLIPLVIMTLMEMLPRLYTYFEWQFAQGVQDNIVLLVGSLLIVFVCVIYYVYTTIKFSRMFNSPLRTTFLAILAIINALNIIPYIILSIQAHRQLTRYGVSGFSWSSESKIREKVVNLKTN